MTRLQRITLTIILFADLAMLLYPPYEAGNGRRVGHDWVWLSDFRIAFVTLAAQIVIVSVIGAVVFQLVRGSEK